MWRESFREIGTELRVHRVSFDPWQSCCWEWSELLSMSGVLSKCYHGELSPEPRAAVCRTAQDKSFLWTLLCSLFFFSPHYIFFYFLPHPDLIFHPITPAQRYFKCCQLRISFCSWTEILKGRIIYGHLCPLSFEELDSYALKTAALRRSQPLLDWFRLQKQSWTETCFFFCLLQVKWNLCRCCVHLVQVLLPKCCSDLFLLARNFLSKWICSMLQSCNSFDYCQDYIYLI